MPVYSQVDVSILYVESINASLKIDIKHLKELNIPGHFHYKKQHKIAFDFENDDRSKIKQN
jgi:hypothetical protein